MARTLTMNEVPELPGYVSVAWAAQHYGVHKATIYNMIYARKDFRSVFKVLKGVDEQRPLLLLKAYEAEQVFKARAESGRARHLGPRLTIDDIPDLPGYVSLAQVAAKYELSKSTIFNMIFVRGDFRYVFKVTRGKGDKRPLLLLLPDEVEEVFKDRPTVKLDRSAALALAEWNRRVKAWATNEGWTLTPIPRSGQPPLLLRSAYVEANPNDPRPAS